MDTLDQVLFKKLTESGSRLPWIIDWLITEVWSPESYLNLSPSEFLCAGEERVVTPVLIM